MDWVDVRDRKPDCDMPVLMHAPHDPWVGEGGQIFLGIFKGGQFLADRPGNQAVQPSHWLGPVVPPE